MLNHLDPASALTTGLPLFSLITAILFEATAGLTGLPVSTTHIVTSDVAGTVVSSGAGFNVARFDGF